VHVAAGRSGSPTPNVILGTAHPAKFPAAVEDACGISPALPAWLSHLMDAKENYTVLPSDKKMLEDHISRHTRARQ
jgi:threonine synthase